MKDLALFVKFNPVKVIEMADRTIDVIYIDNKIIGYIAKNITGEEKIITPFTAIGELPETDCHMCAAKALFCHYADLSVDSVDAAEVRKEISASFEIHTDRLRSFIGALLEKQEKRH